MIGWTIGRYGNCRKWGLVGGSMSLWLSPGKGTPCPWLSFSLCSFLSPHSSTSFSFLGCHEVGSFPLLLSSHHYDRPHRKPTEMQSSIRGLKTLKLWIKINLSSFRFILSGILPQRWKANTAVKTESHHLGYYSSILNQIHLSNKLNQYWRWKCIYQMT